MKRPIYMLAIVTSLFICVETTAQVSLSNDTDEFCMSQTGNISAITIEETLNDDFNATNTPQSIEFEVVGGTLAIGVGDADFGSPFFDETVTIEETSITITFTPTGTHLSSLQTLTISGLQTNSGTPGTMQIRLASSTFPIEGLNVNDVVATVQTVSPPATPTISGASSVCMLESGVNYSVDPIYFNYQWNVSGGTITNGTGTNQITVNWTASEALSVTVTYDNAQGCTTSPAGLLNVGINTVETPAIYAEENGNTDEDGTTCINATVRYVTETGKSNYIWTFSETDGNDTDGGSPLDHFLEIQWGTIATPTSVSVTYEDENGCLSPSGFLSVTIANDGPVVTNSSLSTCNDVSFDLELHTSAMPGSPFDYAFYAEENLNIAGETIAIRQGGLLTDNLTNSEAASENANYKITATDRTSGCEGPEFTLVVTVDPTPIGTPIAPGTEIICSEVQSSLALSASTATDFSWHAFENPNVDGETTGTVNTSIINETLINHTGQTQRVNYVVTPVSQVGACFGEPFFVSIDVRSGPAFMGGSLACVGGPAQNKTYTAINGTGSYTWSASIQGTVINDGDPFDASFTVNWAEDGILSVNYVTTDGCTGQLDQAIEVATQVPAGSPETDAFCSNLPQSLSLNFNVIENSNVPATFSWSADPNPNVTGLSTTTQTTSFIQDTLRNITLGDEIVVYRVIPLGGCGPGAEFTYTQTIHPEPVGLGTTVNACHEAPLNINLDARIAAGNNLPSTYLWIGVENPNVAGISHESPEAGSIITNSLTLTDSEVNSSTFEIIVTPTSNDLNVCEGEDFILTIPLGRPPSATSLSTSVCSGTANNISLQDQVNAAGGNSVPSTFSWSTVASADLTGESTTPQNEPFITDNLVNVTVPGVKRLTTYTVTPSSTVGNCLGSPFTIDIEVNAAPIISENSIAALCSTEATAFDIATHYSIYNINSMLANFSWVAAENPNITGETTAAQTTTQITDVLTNAGNAGEVLVYTITPTAQIGGCTGSPFTLTTTVNPRPATVITNNATSISNNGSTNITLSSPVAGATFNFVPSAPVAISGEFPGTGTTITQVLTNSLTSQQIVTYTATATANGCSGTAFFTTVTVNGMRTIITADSVALVALYNALSGPNWTQSTNWMAGAANTWLGVDVSSERVIGLSLPSNNLSGVLPTGFFNLSQLSLLDLQGNAISGTLPSDISNLSSLQILDVRNNDLTGTLPAEIYNITSLTQLRLSGNGFSGALLPAISNLTSLQTLQVNNLPMTGTIPSEVFGLTSLVNLDLSGKINGPLPASIGSLTALFTFSCDNCAITSVPPSITTLTNLTSLRLNNNAIESLPNMSGLPLSTLDVGRNSLTFESLEPHAAIPNFVYSPQDTVGTTSSAILQTTTPHNFVSNIGGNANVYSWKKNNTTIPSATAATYTITSPVFEDEGSYHVEVTNTLLPGLTISRSPVIAKVSSLKRDSLSLREIFNATGGPSWTTKGGWPNGNLATWTGVVISSNRVTALNLPNNNLTGILPAAFTDLLSLQTANFTGNKLSEIPVVTSMTALTNLNVALNNISFGSLEPNVSALGKLTYAPQNLIGTSSQESLPAGSSTEFIASATGNNNLFQWKRNSLNVAGATASTFTIASLGRNNMGQYVCEIRNSSIPNLTLQTAPKTILATASLSGKIKIAANAPAQKGRALLLRINPSSAFDTVSVKEITPEGNFIFNDVVLDDYQIVASADRATHERALPTYYKNTILWEEADTLFVNNNLVDLDITTVFEPAPPSGRGLLTGTIQEDDGTGSGGRTQLPKPVRQAGVSARRVQSTGRGQEEILTLVSYVFTNDNGEFSLENLPDGNYRLNIQYPGYPMDETSFINFTIGIGLQAEVRVDAQVESGVINVRQLIITSVWSKENYSAEVFPNPTSSIIKMKFGSSSSYRDIGIFDISGKKIRSINAFEDTLEIDVADFRNGMYLLNINEKGVRVKSLHVIIE